jgi:16S rRNA U1498 N3-methylase RsmE
LQDRPSLRYIRDVLRMRSSDNITLRFQAVAELLQALEASGKYCITFPFP